MTDFYNYVNPTENLTTFMHGVGKTTGFDGTWHSVHKGRLYQTNDKAANAATPFFINQPVYNAKWVSFFDMIDTMVSETNAAQDF